MTVEAPRKTSQKQGKYSYQFRILPNIVYEHPSLSHTDIMVWLAIANHYNDIKGYAFVKISTMAKFSGFNESTIKRSRIVLKKWLLLSYTVEHKLSKVSRYDIPLLSRSKVEQAKAIRHILRLL